eukprot:TRINITY_DN4520_c1_g1_i2.p1 TRINITY_DN4520_c1_g1~~TRINITY_DN4520_c1_g1_i2.p1  ORF type:complete len:105 (-),score=21.32 TRINITY_DN4520_c1_g1_i2:249-563(-)
MSSLPKTLLMQMRELKSTAKDGQLSGSHVSADKATDMEYPTLLARRRHSKDSLISSTACVVGSQKALHEQKKFSSVAPNPALSSLQAFQARQQRIASRSAAFVV